jgi:hypothetical protein
MEDTRDEAHTRRGDREEENSEEGEEEVREAMKR